MGGLVCSPLLFQGCSHPAQAIRIGLHAWPGYEPLPLANSMGWLDKKQVQLTETHSATETIQLLEQGKIDGACLTLDEVLRVRGNGIPLSVILVCDISMGADMLLVRPEITTLAQLKGLRIGVEEGSVGALMLYEILQSAGLKRDDVHIVSLTIAQQLAAWQRGEIDALISYEPVASQLKKMGAQTRFDSRQIPEIIVDVIAVRSTLLDAEHGEALRHLLKAHLQALAYLNSSPDESAYRIAAHLKLPHAQVMSSFKGLVLPDLDNNIRLIATANPVLLKNAQMIATILQQAGILHQPDNFKELLHAEFLPVAMP